MTQTYTSANTSINSAKLPAVYNKINWHQAILTNETIMDYGCGKFNNAKDFVEGIGFEWHGYDKYNRSKEENGLVLDFLLEKGTADEAKKAYLEHIDKGLAEIKKKIAGGELLSPDYEYAYYVYNNTVESISKAASYTKKEGS